MKVHLCLLAARRIRETYLNAGKVEDLIYRPCKSYKDYQCVWSIYEKFVKIDFWINNIFDELMCMVHETDTDFLRDMEKKAREEIELGLQDLRRMRNIEPLILSWCRKRHP